MNSPPPFLVMALPRSRTAWLSKLLTYGPWICGHEQIRYFRGLDDIKSWVSQPYIGSAETMASAFWRLIPKYMPEGRVLIIRRPVVEVVESILKQAVVGIDRPTLINSMRQLDAKLDQAEVRLANCISVNFNELSDPGIAQIIFEHCLGLRFDLGWWDYWNKVNVQINFDSVVRYIWANMPQLVKLSKQARHKCITEMKPVVRYEDGVTFQVESFEKLYADATELFEKHLVHTDQSPDDYLNKNVDLFRKLDDLGALQVLTARCNGKMFGYLATVISPSLDSPHETNAEHTIFFADPAIHGLGMRLQREAVENLKARGVTHVLMRAGHRGSGPRLGTFYRRLGAEEFGELYRLELE